MGKPSFAEIMAQLMKHKSGGAQHHSASQPRNERGHFNGPPQGNAMASDNVMMPPASSPGQPMNALRTGGQGNY